MADASAYREQLKNTLSIVETVHETQYRPLKDQVDLVTAKFSPLEKSLTSVVKSLNSSMGAYQTKLIKDAQIEAEKIAARIGEGKGHLKFETAMAKLADITRPEVLAETGFINRPKLSIVDITLIPKEYFVLDEKALKAALDKGVVVPVATLVDSFEPRSK